MGAAAAASESVGLAGVTVAQRTVTAGRSGCSDQISRYSQILFLGSSGLAEMLCTGDPEQIRLSTISLIDTTANLLFRVFRCKS
jgi:hypothetical protein